MLSNSDFATAREVIKVASSNLGFDFIDDQFSINSEDEAARGWKVSLEMAIDTIMSDIFSKNIGFFKEVGFVFPEEVQGYYRYSTSNLSIYRLTAIFAGAIKLFQVQSILDLASQNQASFVLQPLRIITKANYEKITLEYLSKKIFSKVVENEEVRSDILEDNEDKILIDKWLVIHKLTALAGKQKAILNWDVYENEYQKRLLYIIENGLSNSYPISLI